jgi:hypothetical protein
MAGLGTLITTILLVTTQFSDIARAFGVAVLMLLLGALFVLGTRRSRTSVAVGGCHSAAALLLHEPESSTSHRAHTDLPVPLTDGGEDSAK